MPIRSLRRLDSGEATLLAELIAEWENPTEDPSRPIIIEDGANQQFRPVHLYVIWDAWQSLEQRDRSEIIMDACEAVRPAEVASRVTVAMGLTHEDAQRMKISYA